MSRACPQVSSLSSRPEHHGLSLVTVALTSGVIHSWCLTAFWKGGTTSHEVVVVDVRGVGPEKAPIGSCAACHLPDPSLHKAISASLSTTLTKQPPLYKVS
ncbi:hypothetical protein K461DRAFT_144142 [Myriangium duriaei CBS 260.36]|uniref:Uncharacterized protein n=1 Tax=Myriangium duriaei CBS 260.36 TaxID=1168546 RepID=A0A9P4MJP3_9PEZI|nr:hypothetical protein K461DRAFT_144142 [Myriangium duriaei CBS 260.36]